MEYTSMYHLSVGQFLDLKNIKIKTLFLDLKNRKLDFENLNNYWF